MADDGEPDLLFPGDRARPFFSRAWAWKCFWPQMLPLFLTGLAVLWAAVRRFHKTL